MADKTLARYGIVSQYINNQTDENWQRMIGQVLANLDYAQCERGQNLFTETDGNGDFTAWFAIGDLWLEIDWRQNNYPALNVRIKPISELDLATHINENLRGWFASKCNIQGVNLNSAGFVIDPDTE